MHNDSELNQMSATCLDDDCNIGVVDIDGDGIPDYVVLRIRWIVSILISLASMIVYKII